MTTPPPSDVRYRLDPGDVPAEKAVRQTIERFNELLSAH